MSVLCLNAVSKHYADTRALDNVSIDFAENSITAIIGRSGCGKSTLLRACNGMVVPEHGSVSVLGERLDQTVLSNLRRKMGYAVQGTGLFPHLNAKQNISIMAELEGWPIDAIENRLAELQGLTQLSDEQISKFPHELSGGQQQRVGLCRAMMLKPPILLLDEPFAAIDPITRDDIHHQLRTLHAAEPSTAVLITHDMREAMLLADHLAVMDSGKIVITTTPEQLRHEYPGKAPEDVLPLLMAAGKA
ncbi:MAG: ATP-binding cassette domain-containing protein [Pseudomonadota bacterium]